MSSFRLLDVMQPRIMLLEIHNWCKWLDFNMAKSPRIVCFYIFLTGTILYNLRSDNVMRLTILKRKCACGSGFVKIIWKPLSLKMSTTLRVRSSAELSAEIIKE